MIGTAEACNFIKIETLVQDVSCEFCEISKNTVFIEHVWATPDNYSWTNFWSCQIFTIEVIKQRFPLFPKGEGGCYRTEFWIKGGGLEVMPKKFVHEFTSTKTPS